MKLPEKSRVVIGNKTFTKEIPDELAIEVGLMEKPKAKEPEDEKKNEKKNGKK